MEKNPQSLYLKGIEDFCFKIELIEIIINFRSYRKATDDDWRRYYQNSYIIDTINKLEYLELNKGAHKIIKDNLLIF